MIINGDFSKVTTFHCHQSCIKEACIYEAAGLRDVCVCRIQILYLRKRNINKM